MTLLPAISFDICHRQPNNTDFVKSFLNIVCLFRSQPNFGIGEVCYVFEFRIGDAIG